MNTAQPLAAPASLDSILSLARHVPVFPCSPTDKTPRTASGFKDASMDPATVRTWWQQWPDSLAAIPTGKASGLFCVDVDSYKKDEASEDWIAQNTDVLMGTRVHWTARGGRHYLFRQPAGVETKTAAHITLNGRKLDAIDVRGDGGYVVWWPAHGLHAEGHAQPMPDVLVEQFKRQANGHAVPLSKTTSAPEAWAVEQPRLAAALPYCNPADHDFWFRAGMAIHLASGGSDAGFGLWHAWSQGGLTGEVPPNYTGEDDCRRRWNSFRHDTSTPVTLGTIFAAARGAGFERQLAYEAHSEGPGAENKSSAVAGPQDVWPDALAEPAFQGLIGDIARAIEPDTESDPAAILLQVLVAFGALVGRGPHVRVEGDQHHLNMFALLVGDSSKARKGTSWSRVRELFSQIRTGWPRVVNGLSSGEGLKYNVRDPVIKQEKDKKTGHMEEVQTDSGIADKRLLVVESEFAQVLRQVARPGNTLSSVVRAAWDGTPLMSLTKNDPVTATGAHISIVGHITIDELRAELTATDSANGFANRFLFMVVKRSKLLPFGGNELGAEVVRALLDRITTAVERARGLSAVGMSASARQVWAGVYPRLSQGHPGLLGAVTARAEAQCIRLALAYALADESDVIDTAHLLAAISVWERSEASARHIFGSALGDRVADEINRALMAAGAQGVTRTEISGLFKRHESAERIGAALDLLARRGFAQRHQDPGHGGRPAEVWRATSCERSEKGEKRS